MATTPDAPVNVVFVHGFLDDAEVWQNVTSALGASVQAIAVDLAGMSGDPGAGGPFTLERYVADVGGIVDAVDGPVVLVGQSMGAQIAELVAADRGDRVAGLVLLTPVPLAGTRLPAEAIAPFVALGGQEQAQREARQGLSVMFPEAELNRLARRGAAVAPEAVAAVVQAWNSGHPAGETPSAYRGPVLILRGAADPFCTEEVVTAGVSSRFPQARVVTIADAGHWAHAEQPAAVAMHLDAFVAEQVRQPGNTAAGVDRQGWTNAFADKTAAAFAEALAPDVELHASALFSPITGAEQVQQVMAEASGIYEFLVFTHQADGGSESYLQWQARAFGGVEFEGVTILTKNADGRIKRIAIHHRPLQAALTFSRVLGERLKGTIDAAHFYVEASK